MIFKSVDLSNGELLLNLVELKNQDEVMKNRGYGRNTQKVLDEIELSFRLGDVTPIEAIALKTLSTDFHIIDVNYMDLQQNSTSTILQMSDDYKESQHKTVHLFEHLFSKFHPDGSKFERIGYPMCAINYDVWVTFKGYALMQLYGYDFHKFFEVAEDSNISLNEAVESNIINLTMSVLYRYIKELFNYNDPLSDAIIHSKYENIPSDESIILDCIIGPDGLYIPFIGDNDVDIASQVNHLSELLPLTSKIRYRFLCQTSFETFTHIFLTTRNAGLTECEKDIVKNYQSLLQLIGNPTFYVPEEFLEQYSVRISQYLVALNSEAQYADDQLHQLYYILNNVNISYTIELDMDDMVYIATSSNDNSYKTDEIDRLFDKIKQTYNTIRNIVDNS